MTSTDRYQKFNSESSLGNLNNLEETLVEEERYNLANEESKINDFFDGIIESKIKK